MQYSRPNGDVQLHDWTDQGSGTTDIFQAIDESSPSDADYIQIPAAPYSVGDTYICSLGAVSDPSNGALHTLRIRLGGVGSVQTGVAWQLIETGVGTVASGTFTTNVTGDVETFETLLSGSEADAITNYANLRVSLQGGGNATRVYWVEFEVPPVAQTVGVDSGVPTGELWGVTLNTSAFANDASPYDWSVFTGASASGFTGQDTDGNEAMAAVGSLALTIGRRYQHQYRLDASSGSLRLLEQKQRVTNAATGFTASNSGGSALTVGTSSPGGQIQIDCTGVTAVTNFPRCLSALFTGVTGAMTLVFEAMIDSGSGTKAIFGCLMESGSTRHSQSFSLTTSWAEYSFSVTSAFSIDRVYFQLRTSGLTYRFRRVRLVRTEPTLANLSSGWNRGTHTATVAGVPVLKTLSPYTADIALSEFSLVEIEHALAHSCEPSSVDSGESVGSPLVAQGEGPSIEFSSGVAFVDGVDGVPTVDPGTVELDVWASVDPLESFGEPVVRLEGSVAFSAGVDSGESFGDATLALGVPPRSGSLVPVTGAGALLTDAEVAALSGAPEAAVRAFTLGVPYWGLERCLGDVARAFGVDPDRARAAYARAKRAPRRPGRGFSMLTAPPTRMLRPVSIGSGEAVGEPEVV